MCETRINKITMKQFKKCQFVSDINKKCVHGSHMPPFFHPCHIILGRTGAHENCNYVVIMPTTLFIPINIPEIGNSMRIIHNYTFMQIISLRRNTFNI